jgi:DNA (cytosine-5)-methyltransferase 1
MTLTAVSLFAGVGGFDLAMQRNGIDVVATVEIDKAARGVLQHQFPKAKHFEDVTKVSADELRDAGFVPERGIITGGFPCQDLSVAGKRAGLAGERSGLFWEIVRLLDELKPLYFVLENVPGLLSSNGGRDFGTVLGALVGGGYGVSWRIVDSQFFGVPQRRRRVFIVGCLGDDGRTSFEILALAQGLCGDSAKGATQGQDVAKTLTRGSRNNIESEDFVLFGDGRRGHDSIGGGIVNTLEARMGTGGNNVPMLLTMREGKAGGGKGPLISKNQSLTLATGNQQVLFQPSTDRPDSLSTPKTK